MSVELQVLSALLDRFTEEVRQSRGDERKLGRLSLGLQKTLGLTAQEVADLTVEKSGYIQKAAKDDPEPGVMRKLPLREALRNVSVEIVDDSLGRQLRCLRCGGIWQPGFPDGRSDRIPKNGWKCPAGCNASAQFPEVDTGELTYNAMSGYR